MKDIKISNGDIEFVNGDFAIIDSDLQHQQLIIQSSKGEWKESPEVGVGIIDYLADDRPEALLIEIKKQLQYDGVKVSNVKFLENGNLQVDGTY